MVSEALIAILLVYFVYKSHKNTIDVNEDVTKTEAPKDVNIR
jgi:hypothetical protein